MGVWAGDMEASLIRELCGCRVELDRWAGLPTPLRQGDGSELSFCSRLLLQPVVSLRCPPLLLLLPLEADALAFRRHLLTRPLLAHDRLQAELQGERPQDRWHPSCPPHTHTPPEAAAVGPHLLEGPSLDVFVIQEGLPSAGTDEVPLGHQPALVGDTRHWDLMQDPPGEVEAGARARSPVVLDVGLGIGVGLRGSGGGAPPPATASAAPTSASPPSPAPAPAARSR